MASKSINILTIALIIISAETYDLAAYFDIKLLEGDAELSKILIVGFGRAIYDCIKTGKTDNDTSVASFFDFWHDEGLVNENLGCAAYCAATNLGVIDPRNGMLLMRKLTDFLRNNGADREALIILEEVTKCYDTVQALQLNSEDLCVLGAELFKCIKNTAEQLGDIPDDLEDVKMAFNT